MTIFSKFKINPLAILNFATFFQYQRFVMPISFLFYLHNGLNFSQFILCQSIYNATCLIAKISMGVVGDIFPKKFVIIFSYLLFMLRVILWINFSGFWIVLAGEILYGLFKAFYRGNVDSYIYEYLETQNKNKDIIKRYGRLSFYNSLGSAVSCFIGVILYKYYGFKTILLLELATQIIATASLFLLPDLKTITPHKIHIKSRYYLKIISKSIKAIIKDTRVNYYVYYAAMLTGLTSIFVWNFQPLLKISAAPVILFGVINFINQILRGLGGFLAKNFTQKIYGTKIIIIEYIAVLLSFVLLLLGYDIKNYILTTGFLIIICFAIHLFVIFNIYNVSKIHEITYDYRRAATSSANTFFEDFASFFLLLIFKFLYDAQGFDGSLIIFGFISTIMLFPNIKRIKQSVQ